MKQGYAVLLFTILFFSSCSYRYQVYQMESPQVESLPTDWYLFQNEELEVAYDFWSNGGIPIVIVYNKTEKPITLLLDKSRFGVNAYSWAYTDANQLFEGVFVPDEMVVKPGEEVQMETYPVNYYWSRYKYVNNIQRFEQEKSPFKVKNTLVYLTGTAQENRTIENEFYVSAVLRMTRSDFKKYDKHNNLKSHLFFVRKPNSGFWTEVALTALTTLAFTISD